MHLQSSRWFDLGRAPRALAVLCATALALAAAGCAESGADESRAAGAPDYSADAGQGSNSDWGSAAPGESGNNASAGAEPPFIPENEEAFVFSAPAVVGEAVYVANETLNSVAVIDSRNLSVRTVLTGFAPSIVAGPLAESAGPEARVWALNAGSSTVTAIDPQTLATATLPVLRRANRLACNPSGERALAWYDARSDKHSGGQGAGDPASVTVLTPGAAYQVAVGFNIQRVEFVDGGRVALVLTDDGISRIVLGEVAADGIALPVAVVPPQIGDFDPLDVQVLVTAQGGYAVMRTSNWRGLVMTELLTGRHFWLALPEVPTDLEWVAPAPGQASGERLMAVLRGRGELVQVAVPEGIVEHALREVPGAGEGPFATPEGLDIRPLLINGLGAAGVSGDGRQALLFSTVGDEKRAILLDTATGEQRPVAFEKGVRGVLSDARGQTFLVFHTREPGARPHDAVPTDPDFIARSWGISLLDVTSASSRLVLTELAPGPVAQWAPEGEDPRVYMGFELPGSGVNQTPAHRDISVFNLATFRKDTFRLPSLPKGLGAIAQARRIYISQEHAQGRMTFVDVDTQARQTVTGFQLNAGID